MMLLLQRQQRHLKVSEGQGPHLAPTWTLESFGPEAAAKGDSLTLFPYRPLCLQPYCMLQLLHLYFVLYRRLDFIFSQTFIAC